MQKTQTMKTKNNITRELRPCDSPETNRVTRLPGERHRRRLRH